ncbi:hypothetical protein AB4407_08665 [Vibrio sp. 10N.261.46.E11]|uniref:hypothetical protein n=1 Tax=Vibrio sp. 10N.261.46.E11 TaxID=3229662 RepID=UPI00354D52AB
MHYLNNGSQVENVPPLKPRVGLGGYFTESNDDGSPSYPGQDWFNAVIREFQTALSASGVAFNPDEFDNLTKAIKGIIQTNCLVQNRLLPNQNANVIGKDSHPVPSASQYTYPAGEEIAAGWLAVTECVITKVGKELSGTGTYRRTIDGEFPNDHFGVKRLVNTQDKTGVSLTIEAGKTHIDVAFAAAGPHTFPASSEVEGIWPSVGDEVSYQAIKQTLMDSRSWTDLSSSRTDNVQYENELPYPIEIHVACRSSIGSFRPYWRVDGTEIISGSQSDTTAPTQLPTITINPGQTYELKSLASAITEVNSWEEFK